MPVDPLAPTLPPPPLSGGIVINGRRVPVPGVEIVTWLDDAKRAPKVTDGVRRDADEAIAMLWHTSLGILCREALPDAIPSQRAEDLAEYQARSPKPLSWHLTGDTDGTFLQQQDLELWTTWHAGWASSWTVGGELAQRDRRGQLTRPQILAAADVTDAICGAMEFPRRVLVGPDGKPWLGPVLDLVSPRAKHYKTGASLGGRGKTWAGVIAHSHVAHREAGDGKGHGNGRGPGDAGPLLFEELLRRGYAGHVVLPGGRISPDPMPRSSS